MFEVLLGIGIQIIDTILNEKSKTYSQIREKVTDATTEQIIPNEKKQIHLLLERRKKAVEEGDEKLVKKIDDKIEELRADIEAREEDLKAKALERELEQEDFEDDNTHYDKAIYYTNEEEKNITENFKKVESDYRDNNIVYNTTKNNCKYMSLIAMLNENPLKDKIPKYRKSNIYAIVKDLFNFLNISTEYHEGYFFDSIATIRYPAIRNAYQSGFRAPNELIQFGFSEKGIENFDGGFAFSDSYFLYKPHGQKETTIIHLSKVFSVDIIGEKIVINRNIEIHTKHSPFSPKYIADIIVFLVAIYLDKNKLI